MKDTFGSTNSLKGLAICAVLLNHYLNLNIKGDYLWFANLFVGLFFITSGYGIYYSLQRASKEGLLGPENLFRYYTNRLVRIYPLFIIAYLIQCFLFDSAVTSWTLWGLHARGHYWFIPAIIQCYLLAPLMFIAIQKHRFLTLNMFIVFFVAANLVLSSDLLPVHLGNSLKFVHLHWRDVYFLYLLLFALGLTLPHYLDCWKEIHPNEKRYFFMLLLFLVLTMMIVFKYQDSSHYLYSLFTKTICPLLALSIAAVYLLANRLTLPLLAWIGKASYPVYLFHIIMYRSVDTIFGYKKNSLTEFLIIIAVIPLFLFICTIIDRWNNGITAIIRSKLLSKKV